MCEQSSLSKLVFHTAPGSRVLLGSWHSFVKCNGKLTCTGSCSVWRMSSTLDLNTSSFNEPFAIPIWLVKNTTWLRKRENFLFSTVFHPVLYISHISSFFYFFSRENQVYCCIVLILSLPKLLLKIWASNRTNLITWSQQTAKFRFNFRVQNSAKGTTTESFNGGIISVFKVKWNE